jgi:hypothetical protein
MVCVLLTLHHDQKTLMFSSLLILFRSVIIKNFVKSEAPRPQGGACGALAGQSHKSTAQEKTPDVRSTNLEE